MIQSIRRLSRIRVRPRRKATRLPSPDEALVGAALTADQVALEARLHEEAAQTVCAALERMQQRERATSGGNPELEPYLAAYFDASRRMLIEHIAAVLGAQPITVARPARVARRHRRCRPPDLAGDAQYFACHPGGRAGDRRAGRRRARFLVRGQALLQHRQSG